MNQMPGKSPSLVEEEADAYLAWAEQIDIDLRLIDGRE